MLFLLYFLSKCNKIVHSFLYIYNNIYCTVFVVFCYLNATRIDLYSFKDILYCFCRLFYGNAAYDNNNMIILLSK